MPRNSVTSCKASSAAVISVNTQGLISAEKKTSQKEPKQNRKKLCLLVITRSNDPAWQDAKVK